MSLSSVIRYVRALDSAATDGSGKTALAYTDFTAKYLVQGGTLASLTTEDITTLGTYQAPTSAAHIRIKELSSSDPCKGVYEVHFHNTQLAASGKKLWLFLSAAGAALQPLELELVPYLYHDNAAADNFYNAVNCIGFGVVDSGATTTSIPTSSLTPAAAVTDQFKGRIITFLNSTSTANLKGQATDITASTSGGTFTVTALTTAPSAGDVFVIQ